MTDTEKMQARINSLEAILDEKNRSNDLLCSDNAHLGRQLGALQELLVKLLTQDTVMVSKGGVATYKMVLTVGEFVDLCRAAELEV